MECLNIFRMPCLCAIWDRKPDLSRINHDNEMEEGTHISLSFICESSRSSWHPVYPVDRTATMRIAISLKIKSLIKRKKKEKCKTDACSVDNFGFERE